MAAASSTETSDHGINVIDLLAAQDSENKRAELVRKHDTLKTKMETLRKERAEQSRNKKAITAALKAAKRAKSRIVAKATTLSQDDIVQILCFKNEQDAKKARKSTTPAQVAAAPAAPVVETADDPEI